MAPAGLTRQIATFRHVFGALFEFLGWTYGVVLGGPERAALQDRILSGWAHPDGSTRELLTYLGGLHTTVSGEPPAGRDRYRPTVRRILAGLFGADDPTERGQVLALLHRTLEAARPGCTGVALPRAASVPPAAPPVAAGSPPSQPALDADLPIDVQRVRDETARYRALLIDQKIWEMRGGLAGEVIRNMAR